MYASTDFPSQLTITGLTFYNSGPFSSGFNGGTYTLALSSTSKALDGLDLSNLSNNIGSDNKVVFSGTLPVGPIPVGDRTTVPRPSLMTRQPADLLMDVTSTSASGPVLLRFGLLRRAV